VNRIDNYLAQVPLNTQRLFVMATTASGCEVYVPVFVPNPEAMPRTLLIAHRKALQAQLDRIDAANPPPGCVTKPSRPDPEVA
jgi:hypothetical protein